MLQWTLHEGGRFMMVVRTMDAWCIRSLLLRFVWNMLWGTFLLLRLGSDFNLEICAWIFDQSIRWQNPSEVSNLPEALTVPTMKVDEKDLAITDCKSLFDLTTRTAVPNCQEYRTQLQARAIKGTNERTHHSSLGQMKTDGCRMQNNKPNNKPSHHLEG